MAPEHRAIAMDVTSCWDGEKREMSSLSPARVALLAAREAAVTAEISASMPWEAYCESRKRKAATSALHTTMAAVAPAVPTHSAALINSKSEASSCPILLPPPVLELSSPQHGPPVPFELTAAEHQQPSVPCALSLARPAERATEELSVGHYRTSASWLYGDDADMDPPPPNQSIGTVCLNFGRPMPCDEGPLNVERCDGQAEFPLLALFHAQ